MQILFKVFVYHRYIEHPLEQFVDLLTLTNVSIMLLQDTYAGYYMHGRSLMPFADTSMVELNEQMRKEQNMQVGARGLITQGDQPELKENQCFEVYIDKVCPDHMCGILFLCIFTLYEASVHS